MPARPITEGLLHKVLINPYYKGQTKFQGVHYDGRHEHWSMKRSGNEFKMFLPPTSTANASESTRTS